MYRLATNGEKADGHQKQTSVRNSKHVSTHADHSYSRQRPAAVPYVVRSVIGYHSNSWVSSFLCPSLCVCISYYAALSKMKYTCILYVWTTNIVSCIVSVSRSRSTSSVVNCHVSCDFASPTIMSIATAAKCSMNEASSTNSTSVSEWSVDRYRNLIQCSRLLDNLIHRGSPTFQIYLGAKSIFSVEI